MLILCTSVLNVYLSWFCSTNFIKGKIYWEVNVNIPNDWKSGLHEALVFQVSSGNRQGKSFGVYVSC